MVYYYLEIVPAYARAQDEIENKYTSEMRLVIFVDVLLAISFDLLRSGAKDQ